MSIALIDQDALLNKKDFYFDLDIMKLASYYKSKREITKLLLNATEYTQYSQTYFIKNRFDYKIMSNIFQDPRIIYRGYAFSANEYDPLPDDIERAEPDLSIYDTYLKFNDNIAERRRVKFDLPLFENSCHSRLSTLSHTCNLPTSRVLYKESDGVCLYDYNIFGYDNWKDATEDLKNKSLRMRFSPITSNIEDIIYMLDRYSLRTENHLILSTEITQDILEQVLEYGKNYKDRIKIHILKDLNFYNKEIYKTQIKKALNTILELKYNKTRIHAYIDPRDIDERTAFLNNIAYWSNRNHSDISLKHFITEIRKQSGVNQKMEILSSEDSEINFLYKTKPSEWNNIFIK